MTRENNFIPSTTTSTRSNPKLSNQMKTSMSIPSTPLATLESFLTTRKVEAMAVWLEDNQTAEEDTSSDNTSEMEDICSLNFRKCKEGSLLIETINETPAPSNNFSNYFEWLKLWQQAINNSRAWPNSKWKKSRGSGTNLTKTSRKRKRISVLSATASSSSMRKL